MMDPAEGNMLYNRDPRGTYKRWLRDHRYQIIAFGSLAVLVFAVFHLFSDGDFSFLMTLASVCRMFGFGLLTYKIVSQRRCAHISLKMMQAYLVSHVLRLCSILVYEGYLPFDKTGDYLYHVFELACTGLLVAIVAMMMGPFKQGYNARVDSFGSPAVPTQFGVVLLIAPCLLVAVLFHPNLNGNFLTDIAWSWALYLEAVAVVPQLYMFHQRGGEVEPFLSDAMAAFGGDAIFGFFFWLSSYSELNDKYAKTFQHQYPGYLVILCQFVTMVLMANYLVRYVLAAKAGRGMMLPGAGVRK